MELRGEGEEGSFQSNLKPLGINQGPNCPHHVYLTRFTVSYRVLIAANYPRIPGLSTMEETNFESRPPKDSFSLSAL